MSDPVAALAQRLFEVQQAEFAKPPIGWPPRTWETESRMSWVRDSWLAVAREAVVWHEEQLRSCVVIPLMNLPEANNP